MVEPTPALDLAVEKAARPMRDILAVIVAELLGSAAKPILIRDCVASIISQCVYYHHSEAIIQRLHHLDVHDPATIEQLAEHVYRFSLGGVRAIAEGLVARADDVNSGKPLSPPAPLPGHHVPMVGEGSIRLNPALSGSGERELHLERSRT